MPKINYLDIVAVMKNLGDTHIDIKSNTGWNPLEAEGTLREGLETPVLLIDDGETKTSANNKNQRFHKHITAWTILEKPNTTTGSLNEFQAEDKAINDCEKISFELETRLLHNASLIKDSEGEKNWLYGMVKEEDFHHYKVGPLFSEELFGIRCEIAIKNQIPTTPDKDKWNDL